MGEFWLVAKQEYRNRTFKRSFIIGTLIIPFMLAIIIGVTIFIIERSFDDSPFGFVDNSGALRKSSVLDDAKDTIEIIPFENEESAKIALESEEIQGYYLIPEDYLITLYVDLYYLEEVPTTRVLNEFDDYIRSNILDKPPTPIQLRIIEGTTLIVKAVNDNREFQDNAAGIIIVLMPLLFAMFFLFVVLGASGYFLQVVTDEKESRTMEIMITSTSPAQLITGKSLGLIAVGLTQIFVWVMSIVIAWIAAKQFIEIFQYLQIPWDVLIIFAVFFFPSYGIIAGLMICIGSVVSELQEGQQISGIINLLFTFPIFFAALVFANPDSPLLKFLSFWPTTALMTIIMRWGFTTIPIWQVALSWFICVITSMIIIFIASRLFRLGMLRYGQRVSFKTAFSALLPIKQD